jgi:hypothetical protein
MSENPRDTQFAGFAAALGAEIANTDGWNLADVEKLIARRAYDLVDHVVCWIDPLDFMSHENPLEYIINAMPDLTELPKEQRNEKQ